MQLRAFLYGGEVEVTSSRITITFHLAQAFQGKHTLFKFEQLVDLVSRTFGTITLEVITPEERRSQQVQQAPDFQPLEVLEVTSEGPPASHLVQPAPPQ